MEDKNRLPILQKYASAKIALQTVLNVGGGSRAAHRNKRKALREEQNLEDDLFYHERRLRELKKPCLSGSYGEHVVEGDW